MNNYFIKIHGKANIPVPISIGHNYKLVADCSVTQEQKNDNHDGSYDIIYKVEPVTIDIGVDNGPTVRAKDPRRNSVKIRNYLFKLYTQEGLVEPFDDIYDQATLEILSVMPAILQGAVKRLEK